MDLGIKGKNAIVCASSKGLGRASAEGLAAEGVNLVICARGKEALVEAAESIRAAHDVRVVPVTADVSVEQDRERVVSTAIERLGGVDILVNNAGGPPAGGFGDFDLEEYRKGLELNLLSAVDMIRRTTPLMEEAGWGRIVNIASIAVKQPIPNLILSNTARTGLIGFAKTAATELAPKGILINNVCPGTIFTDRIRELSGVSSPDEDAGTDTMIGEMVSRIPLGRMGRPEELAALVVFLCSERVGYITGATIQVDGGMFSGLM